LLLEQGVDPDHALNLQLAHFQNLFDDLPSDKAKELSNIDDQ
jgi:hypothetical protein